MNFTDTCEGRCPYLSESGHECLMTNGGLYIPMPEHINTLCLTPIFCQCYQYIQGCSTVRELAGQLGCNSMDSRRRYSRITTRIPLQISDCGHDGRGATVLDHEAFSVDLSFGGIRLESRIPMPLQGKIAFVAGSIGNISRWEGQGEVRWTDELENGVFQSGLMVTDKKTFQAIGQHLSLSCASSL